MSHRGDTRSGDAAGGDVEQEQKEEVEEEVAAVRPTEPSVSGGDVERRWSETCVQVKVERQEEDDDDKSYGGVPVPVVPSPSSPCSSRRHRSGPWPRQGTGGCLDHAWGRDAAGSPETAAVGMSWVCGIAARGTFDVRIKEEDVKAERKDEIVDDQTGSYDDGGGRAGGGGKGGGAIKSEELHVVPRRHDLRIVKVDTHAGAGWEVVLSRRMAAIGSDNEGGAGGGPSVKPAELWGSRRWAERPAASVDVAEIEVEVEEDDNDDKGIAVRRRPGAFSRGENLSAALGFRPPGFHSLRRDLRPLRTEQRPLGGDDDDEPPRTVIANEGPLGPEAPTAAPMTARPRSFRCRDCGEDAAGGASRPDDRREAHVKKPGHSHHWRRCPACERASGAGPSHVCPACGKSFVRAAHLKIHVMTHTGEKPHVCPICGKAFTQTPHLKIHMMTHTGEKPNGCRLCGKGFICPSKLRIHMRTHTGERPHVCPVCSNGFTQSSVLKSHMLTHTGERPHRCAVCGHGFTQSSYLKSHMRTHTGDKPHPCAVCGKRFICPSKVRVHMRTHTGERPHRCPVCGNSFTQSSILKSHMLTHTGERPHRCPVCAKCYADPSYLKSHVLIHSGERPHACAVCGKSFTHSKVLRRHMATHSSGRGRQGKKKRVGGGYVAVD
ncbi:uncharacterized protein LOC144737649 isoform X3 [Lampetra planeri]